jgi:VanZ like family/Concanavalin A-like lectin/glucanases superfamily
LSRGHLKKVFDRRKLGWLSVVLVAGYLIAGLWPFAFRPANQVSWLPDRTGLIFQDDGIAYDPESLPASETTRTVGQPANYSVELWVEAGNKPATDVFHLLTINDGRLPSKFVLCQWQKEIILRAAVRGSKGLRKIHEVGADGALVSGKARCITVTGSADGTDFYVNGVLAGHFPEFILDSDALAGQMVLGNSADGRNSWVGRLFGLAIYQRTLTATEIAAHQTLWTQGSARQLANTPELAALYLFGEGSGREAPDLSRQHHRLLIPEIFRPLLTEFLIPPWRDMSYDAPNYRDLALNILGFVPFGICLFRFRRLRGTASKTADALIVVGAGFAISLTIETVQVWLPNRVSSMNDLLCNTAGTLLGVLLALAVRRSAATAPPAFNSPRDDCPAAEA